eukprot:tig00001220_g7617.t1
MDSESVTFLHNPHCPYVQRVEDAIPELKNPYSTAQEGIIKMTLREFMADLRLRSAIVQPSTVQVPPLGTPSVFTGGWLYQGTQESILVLRAAVQRSRPRSRVGYGGFASHQLPMSGWGGGGF